MYGRGYRLRSSGPSIWGEGTFRTGGPQRCALQTSHQLQVWEWQAAVAVVLSYANAHDKVIMTLCSCMAAAQRHDYVHIAGRRLWIAAVELAVVNVDATRAQNKQVWEDRIRHTVAFKEAAFTAFKLSGTSPRDVVSYIAKANTLHITERSMVILLPSNARCSSFPATSELFCKTTSQKPQSS